ncbi:VSP S8 [Giardia duodenalis]|uniref:VSP S8 n=2 Tax=Giardia intestinalis TaxID=5741 RepID=A0A644FBL1_GIAIC|nr:VSP S8 [Giardia intestinalis]KAE8306023.1 VSP S8 [Giardia intestinalis]
MFEKIIFGIAILQVVWAATTCTEASSDPQTGQCATGKCDVWIGGSNFCSQCSTAAEYLINGLCYPDNKDNGCEGQPSTGVCTQCAQGFFLHRGGCYKIGTEPGNLICEDTQASQTQGVCEACSSGYFKNPAADAAGTPPCIACNDTVGNSNNVGIANCKTCASPSAAGTENAPQTATCTACVDGFSPDSTGKTCVAVQCAENCLTCTSSGEDKCKSCKDGYFLGAASGGEGKCIKCNDTTGANSYKGIANCAKCTQPQSAGPAVCTECAADLYLKIDRGVMECVAAAGCGEGFFPTTVGGVKKCIGCSEAGNGGIDKCAKCTLKTPAPEAGVKVTCSECDSQKKLSPLKDECMDSCPAGTYDKQNVCTPCHSSCASCTDATSTTCTACYPGFVLNAASGASAGTCIPECTGQYAENCADGQCTAIVGGSKYCSKCKAGYVPVDGVCVSTTTRAVTGCTPGDGVCTACTGSYFLQSGGCYQSTTYPGNTLCSSATNGKCQTCANGQTADNQGSCPACPDGCSKCTGSASPQQCQTCLPGYYKSGDSCVKCDASANGIVGVPNCISCAPPAGGSGSVTCYVKTDGTSGGDDNTGGSANRSGLSTGAIAGISVAVIVVVAGLVGFLCWWFICRGKA